MNFLYSIIIVISTLYINGVLATWDADNYFTIEGQVIYTLSSQILIEHDSQLIIELQDISVTDELAKTIAKQISSVVAFPIIFNISYTPDQVIYGHVHVLNAKVINLYDDLLFVNEKRSEVKLLGAGRTTFIDVPVVPVSYHDLVPPVKLREWPELVGKDGNEAVDMIKQETGYENVFVVTDGTEVTKDLRYDRVCVYVDENGKVAQMPRTA